MTRSALTGARGVPERWSASWGKMKVLSRMLGLAVLGASLMVEPAMAGPMQLSGDFAVSSGGSATYNIPIAVPPGTAGMVPNLSLDYSSGRGSGIVGVGWALNGFSAIRRCAQTQAQDSALGRIGYDANDRYCLDGSRLMVVAGTHGADLSEYRTEVESFAKVIAHGVAGNGPSWFEVRLPSGRVMELGNTTDSKILATGRATVRVWAVNKITDTKGNYQTFTYNNDTANGSYYPTRIDYTGNAGASLAPYASVQFSYVARPATDQVVTYVASSTVKLVQQLSEIKTYTEGAQVLSYKLGYEATANSATGVPRLASVQMCDPANLCQPATTFTWSNASTATVTYGPWQDWLTAPGTVSSSKPVMGVTNGSDGFGGTTGGRGGGTFPNSRPIFGEFTGSDGDINGDGRTDVLINQNAVLWTSLSTGTGFTAAVNTGITAYAPQLIDLFGNGRSDIVALNASNQLVRYANNGAGGFATTPTVLKAISVSHPAFGDNYTPIFTDLNADGLPDIQWHNAANSFFFALNTGSGFGATQAITAPWNIRGKTCSSPCTPDRIYGYATTQFANFTGRGSVDLVFTFQSVVGSTCNDRGGCSGGTLGPWEVWRAIWTGASFAAPVKVYSTASPYLQTFPQVTSRLADINGDGLSDLFVSFPPVNDTRGLPVVNHLFYLGNGNGLNATVAPNLDASTCAKGLAFRDIYGSGRTDGVCNQGGPIRIARPNAAATAFVAQTSLTTGPAGAEWWMKDFNGDDYLDFLVQDSNNHYRVALSNQVGGAPGDLLTGITTGLGATVTIAYDALAHGGSSLYTKGTSGAYPTVDTAPSDYVVTRVDRSNGIGGQFSSSYKYGGARFDARGRGYLGLGSMTATDLGTNIQTATSYRLDYPYIGLVSSDVKSLGAVTLANVVNTYDATSLGGTRFLPFLTGSLLQASDLDGSALPSVTTSYLYDAFNNPTQVSAVASDGYSKTTTNLYTNDVTRWILGLLTQSQESSTTP